VNVNSSFVEHVSICNRCKDVDIDACNAHASTILKLNNEVTNLNGQLKICKSEYEKIKFARDTYTIGRHNSIKDGLGFQTQHIVVCGSFSVAHIIFGGPPLVTENCLLFSAA
jgi:hypothetical protein